MKINTQSVSNSIRGSHFLKNLEYAVKKSLNFGSYRVISVLKKSPFHLIIRSYDQHNPYTTYNMLFRKPWGKRPLQSNRRNCRPTLNWVQTNGCDAVDWSHPPRDRTQWCPPVNTLPKRPIPQTVTRPADGLWASQEPLCSVSQFIS
jgi:hypothetical protein